MTVHALAMQTGVAYLHLQRHVKKDGQIGLKVAKRLEEKTGGVIRAAHILGLDVEETAEAVDLRSRSPKRKKASEQAA